MERFFLQIALWLCVGGMTLLHAQPRSMDELDSIANSVLRVTATRSFVSPLQMSYTASQVLKKTLPLESEAFYIYTPTMGDNRNFVIVSGDRRMPAVLGYSSDNSFDLNNIPDGLRWYLQKCQADVERLSLQENGQVAFTRGTDAVSPLLDDIVWNQGEPFNNLCPEANAWVRTVTGCTATAMAQVMAFHKHPQKGTGKIYYTTPSFDYVVNADLDNAPAYDWGNMKGDYSQGYTDEQAEAVARLMFHAAATIKTDFGEENSGADTNSPEAALLNHFNYDDGIRIIRASDCHPDSWTTALDEELYASRPVIVSGFDTNYSNGHAFIFDGLDHQGMYHVNWGWSGLCNGYYNFYNLVPDETGIGGGIGDFSYYLQAVIGICPDDGVAETEPTNLVAGGMSVKGGLGTFDLSKSLSLSVQSVQNMRHLTFYGRLQLMLTNAEGTETVAMLGSSLPISGLELGYMLNDAVTLSGTLPNDLAEGSYRLYVAARQNGYDQWGRVRTMLMDVKDGYDYYTVIVRDEKYVIESTDSEVDDSNAIDIPMIDYIIYDDTYYDLHGRALPGRPTQKGIYIRQGEKVVVK